MQLSIRPVHTDLQNVQSSKFSPSAFLRAVHLSTFDDDSVCRQVDTPSQCSSGHKNLDVSISKQILHQCTVHSGHTSVVDCKAIRQQILQLEVLDKKVQVFTSIRIIIIIVVIIILSYFVAL